MGNVVTGILGAFGLSASAGLNAYIPLLVVSLLAKFTNLITLSKPWDALTSWWTIGVLTVLVLVEAIADKVPAVDHVNDAIQTFIRPTAGAIVFAASAGNVTEVSPVLSLICGLLVAGTVHTVKSVAVRPLITATTAGVGDPVVSTAEDVAATVISVLSVALPILMLVVLVLLIWALAALIRRLRKPSREYYQE
ncbi:MAG: DUF4126 domain-containing protein [Chloroflexi bacterium]|jgi:hypothetical protein|nr:DUF4126 domain-containing protein [Anaerolineaceae bacterium]NLI43927.1 DUF4126 domain-containing protein [Chloroflexota bacterium]HOE35193.1 DUF4126 domain-containing protein [Anaerolineaceae bacterium]HOT26121.1 DUF4126 domain-containing protein [Anaerolineaceae bacterium]HQH58339.1 DUF4126 domain-containing protein [Anaerolineaceae bacterium]